MKDFTEIVVVLDRSGSMHSVVDDTIGGFDSFVETQKKAGDNASLTLVQFDDEYEVVYQDKAILSVPSIKDIYRPRGCTALLDAIGKTIVNVGTKLASKSESDRPNKVIFVIITDGEENSSKEYTKEKVFEMVRHQESIYKWEFVFLGANQDAIQTGSAYGFKAGSSVTYNTQKTSQTFNAVGDKVAMYRSLSPVACSDINSGDTPLFDDDDREEVG
jgi:Mg-chelatase subunit ChlD